MCNIYTFEDPAHRTWAIQNLPPGAKWGSGNRITSHGGRRLDSGAYLCMPNTDQTVVLTVMGTVAKVSFLTEDGMPVKPVALVVVPFKKGLRGIAEGQVVTHSTPPELGHGKLRTLFRFRLDADTAFRRRQVLGCRRTVSCCHLEHPL